MHYTITAPNVKGENKSYWDWPAITTFEADTDEQAIAEFEQLAKARGLVGGGINWAPCALLCRADQVNWIYPVISEKEYADRWRGK